MTTLNRRHFLQLVGIAGTGLVLGVRLPDTDAAELLDPAVINMAQDTGLFVPNVYLRIAPDDTVTIIVHRTEMGQGVNTAIPMILGDELEVDWTTIRIQQAPPDRAYGDQVTGGSQSIQSSYMTLRVAGATARTMLVSAAALGWAVPPEECVADNGRVVHRPTGNEARYGALAVAAAALPVPGQGEFALKDPSEFRYIGTPQGHIDGPDIVTGRATYCSDITLPGMVYAVLARPPQPNARLVEFDPADAEAVPGVLQVFRVEGTELIAVIASSTWAALQGRDALRITWDESRDAEVSTTSLRDTLGSRVSITGADSRAEAIYEVPYLAHATMEPMTCVADVRADSCEVWAPTQDRQQALRTVRTVTRLSEDAITLHVPLVGGGFGRRLNADYVMEATLLSRLVGAPVKLFWSREDDMQHDFYHPFSHNYRARLLDNSGRWESRAASAFHLPTGAWRSVDNFPTALANECFVDEFAIATGRDPYEMHLEVHAGTPRQAVLELAAEGIGWGGALPTGWGRGIAVHSTFGVTHVAMAAEVSVENGNLRVRRVVCAVDCGTVVNPDTVTAQMEGGIVFGLSALLHGEITVEAGRVQQGNFHDYPILEMSEMPQVDVIIVESDSRPQGIGEMGVPPIAPAVLNAVYNATGKRIRHLPIRPADLA